jgi:nitronate monooxygenase
MRIDVEGAGSDEEWFSHFDPAKFCEGQPPQLKRPNFLPIISSATLAITLAKKSTGKVNGFIVEGPLAGGHNAPPRGALQLTGSGEPIYGTRDLPDLEKIKALGLPFWLAGDYGHPGRFYKALETGATGVQVGTAFAFCNESGIEPSLKARVLAGVRQGKVQVFTDPVASPTGFPFKVVRNVEGTIAFDKVYEERERICDLGYLRHPYKREDGLVGYRCSSEPVNQFTRKGGEAKDTEGRVCLCNGLLATAGLAQKDKNAKAEPPVVTAGDDLVHLSRFFRGDTNSYGAADVIACILSKADSTEVDTPLPAETVAEFI